MEEQKAQISMIMLIVLLAVILGAFAFMIYLAVRERPFPVNTQVEVAGQMITLAIDPNERVEIVGDAAPPAPVVLEVAPEATPVPEVVTLEEVATPIPEVLGAGGSPEDMFVYQWHVVQANDTLYSLANQFNTTIPLLARFGTSTLIPGDQVLITMANPAYCPSSGWYIAREGDSPGGIAAMYNTTLDVLNQLNNWNGVYAVYETNVVCVP